MPITYDIELSIDLGNVLPRVGDFLKEMNTHLAEMGCAEKLGVRSKCLHVNLTSERELTEDEKDKVKKTVIETFAEQQPAWKVQVESFRRKSGNVQQSASQ